MPFVVPQIHHGLIRGMMRRSSLWHSLQRIKESPTPAEEVFGESLVPPRCSTAMPSSPSATMVAILYLSLYAASFDGQHCSKAVEMRQRYSARDFDRGQSFTDTYELYNGASLHHVVSQGPEA